MRSEAIDLASLFYCLQILWSKGYICFLPRFIFAKIGIGEKDANVI